jgi:hypothetical protein
LGIEPDMAGIKPYLVDTEIIVRGQTIYKTPALR